MQRQLYRTASAALALLMACSTSRPMVETAASPGINARQIDESTTLMADGAPGPQPQPSPAPEARPGVLTALFEREEADKKSAAPVGGVPPPRSPAAPAKAKPAAAAPAAQSPNEPAQRASVEEIAAVRGPLLIYTAQITMAVFEVNASLGLVEALARDLGGFLARRDDAAVTIRIPAGRFDEAVKRIEKIGDMIHRNVVAEDVTEEFHDLDVQLRSLRAVQERLLQLLAKATKVEESVMIERELSRVTGEIDRIEGRMKFLKDRATYSTITVTFQPKATETLGQTPFRLPGAWLYQLGLGRLLSL